MATVKERINARKALEMLENARKNNIPLIEEECRKLGLIEVPEAIRELFFNVDKRISVIRFTSFEDCSTKPAITAECDGVSISIGESDTKTGGVSCFVFHDELAKRAKALASEARRKGNCERIRSYLEGDRRKLGCSEQMERFVLEVLPENIPYTLSADGSDLRVRSLKNKADAKVYASEATMKKILVPDEEYVPGNLNEEDIFAVEYAYRGSRMLTIFVREHDYKAEWAKRMEIQLGITDSLANQISQNLRHDAYYGMAELYTSFETFVSQMSKLSGKKDGDTIHDYVSDTELDVLYWDEIKETVIDADDAKPCAILIRGKIHVFIPDSKMA